MGLCPEGVSAIPDMFLVASCTGNRQSSHPLPPFCRSLAAAARSLSQLAALPQPGSAAPWWGEQVDAACHALESLARLGHKGPPLSGHAASEMGAACSLLFGPGKARLHSLSAAILSGEEGDAAGILHEACRVQILTGMGLLAGLLHNGRPPQAVVAFAASTAAPSALLPWLATVSQALPLTLASNESGEKGLLFWGAPCLPCCAC